MRGELSLGAPMCIQGKTDILCMGQKRVPENSRTPWLARITAATAFVLACRACSTACPSLQASDRVPGMATLLSSAPVSGLVDSPAAHPIAVHTCMQGAADCALYRVSRISVIAWYYPGHAL